MASKLKEINVEDTLEDDAWMDSFDKLLKARPILRDLNVIKKDIHASYNIDSSIENSEVDQSDIVANVPQKETLGVRTKCSTSISTPLTKIHVVRPFICSLSPIGAWQYRYFDNLPTNNISNVKFSQGTPNRPDVVVVDCNSICSAENLTLATLKKKELSLLPIPNKTTKNINRRVRFESNMEKTNLESSSSKNLRSSAPASYKNTSGDTNAIIKPGLAKKLASVRRNTQNTKSGKQKSSVECCGTSFQIEKRRTNNVNPEKDCESESRSIVTNNSKELKKSILAQRTSKQFNQLYDDVLKTCNKIGEGASSEVLINQNDEFIHYPAEDLPLPILESDKNSLLTFPHKDTNKKKRQAYFEISQDDSSRTLHLHNAPVPRKKISQLPNPIIKSGKWRKSLNVWRRTQNLQNEKPKSSGIYVIADESVEICNVSMRIGERKSIYIKSEKDVSCNIIKESEKRVLARCQQRRPMPFGKLYNEDLLKNCRKIGEGAYGEVFINKNDNTDDVSGTVMKVIPIEGKKPVNGEVQKTFEEILPEIVITMELSNLDNINNPNSTIGFIKINRVTCVKGKYPTHLVKHWEAYDEEKISENDHPAIFTSTQLYIVLELTYGGKDLEKFEFTNAEQSYCVFEQLVMSFAVAEEMFQFEHRDLHWGNILINKTTEESFQYKLAGKLVTLSSKGIKASIIDYTLSRMTYGDYVYYNDISNDEELFAATGDYQFDVYRMMKTELKNQWNVYKPKTNIFWLSYVIRKLINGVKYKNKRSKIHTTYVQKLKQVNESILNYESVGEFAREFIIAK